MFMESPTLWIMFFAVIGTLLTINIIHSYRDQSNTVSLRTAFTWVGIWVIAALLFNLLLIWYLNLTEGSTIAKQRGIEFFTAFILEKSLSVDNMFTFLMIFTYFHLDAKHSRRVLLYGAISAIFFRLVIILLGSWLIYKFHWILYLFGAFLFITGIKMLQHGGEEKDFKENRILQWLQKHMRLTKTLYDEHFFVKINYRWYATPLLLALILVEISDLIFATDSIPAVFAVTNNNFIIISSNVFAILGLRSLYFVLAYMADRFHLLSIGIALILCFIGIKMLIAPWLIIPTWIALCAIIFTLSITTFLSMRYPPE